MNIGDRATAYYPAEYEGLIKLGTDNSYLCYTSLDDAIRQFRADRWPKDANIYAVYGRCGTTGTQNGGHRAVNIYPERVSVAKYGTQI
jgi:hypothetical protein